MIITLPVTVRNDAPLGYWLTPILADALSQQLQERSTFYYGKLGLKNPSFLEERAFHEHLDFLKISCVREADATFESGLLELCRELSSVGSVEHRTQECYRCPCGCLELPVHIAMFAKEKTFRRINGSYVCRVCGESGKAVRVSKGFLRVKDEWSLESVGVYPQWYRREIKELERQLREQGISWSRERPTRLAQVGTSIDVELVWSLIPLMLSRRRPGERIRLVVTNHVLRQAVVAILLARALNPDSAVDLIVSPCISHPGAVEKWSLSRLADLGFTRELLRFMLIGSLGWQTKDALLYDAPAVVEHRRFALLERRMRTAQGKPETYDPDSALRNLSQQNLAKGLRHVFNPEHFDYRTLTGLF